jgi:hypothetical protein
MRLNFLSLRGLRSVAILPLGHREADKDWLVNLTKVRRPLEQFITEVKLPSAQSPRPSPLGSARVVSPCQEGKAAVWARRNGATLKDCGWNLAIWVCVVQTIPNAKNPIEQ